MSFGPLNLLTVHAAGQHRVRAVLFEAHHLSIVVGAPDHAALVIHARAGRTDQQHMTATGASLRADMLRIVAGIAGLLHEDGDLLLRRDLVEDVVEQACENPVAARALRRSRARLR